MNRILNTPNTFRPRWPVKAPGDDTIKPRRKPRFDADILDKFRALENRVIRLSHLRTPAERDLQTHLDRAPRGRAAIEYRDGKCPAGYFREAVITIEARAEKERLAKRIGTLRALEQLSRARAEALAARARSLEPPREQPAPDARSSASVNDHEAWKRAAMNKIHATVDGERGAKRHGI